MGMNEKLSGMWALWINKYLTWDVILLTLDRAALPLKHQVQHQRGRQFLDTEMLLDNLLVDACMQIPKLWVWPT